MASHPEDQSESTPKFSKPRHPQNQSPLLSLPAEVHLMILRDLVVSTTGSITPKTCHCPSGHAHHCWTDGTCNQSEREVALNTEILRTCQVLNHEACHLMHECNEIVIEAFAVRRYSSGIPQYWTKSLVKPGVFTEIGEFREADEERKALRKFQAVRFNLSFDLKLGPRRDWHTPSHDVTFGAAFRKVCFNCCDLLEMRVSFNVPIDLRLGQRISFDSASLTAGLIETIRCRELSFPDLEAESYRRIAGLVTCVNEAVLDLPNKAQKIWLLCKELVETSHLIELSQAARIFDVVAFGKAGHGLLDALRDRKASWNSDDCEFNIYVYDGYCRRNRSEDVTCRAAGEDSDDAGEAVLKRVRKILHIDPRTIERYS